MAAEYATCTRHHKISTKITNEMRVSQIQLITQMSGYIKWLCYVLVIPWFVRMYDAIMHERERVHYRTYMRRTMV